MEFNHFPNLEWVFTPWDTIDPYLRGGLPLVDLVDLLTCIGEVSGSLGLLASALAEGQCHIQVYPPSVVKVKTFQNQDIH